MPETAARHDAAAMELKLASAAPLFAFDDDQLIVAWNSGAEELTGISAADAIGQPCWLVLAGRHDTGALMCHKQCSRARHARAGWPVRTEAMNIHGPAGHHRIAVDTVSVSGNGSGLYLHVMRDAPVAADEQPHDELGRPPRLTARQLEVLRLLAEGSPARTIASILGITEATVRNHIRAVLLELGAHSQLEAVYRARGHDLL